MTQFEKLDPEWLATAKPARLSVPVSTHARSSAENDDSAYDLSHAVQNMPRLSEEAETRFSRNMHRAATRVLALSCQTGATRALLRDFCEEVEHDLEKHASPYEDAPPRAQHLDLPGLIDEIDMLEHMLVTASGRDSFHLHHRLHTRRRKLQRRLGEWSIPAYMIMNTLLPRLLSLMPELSPHKALLAAQKSYHHQRNLLAQGNMRLVYSVAAKFRYLGLPYEDLVQEGNLGLIKAVERFRPARGFRFSTYAYRVISQSIHLALDKQSTLVRKPFKLLREKASVEQTRQQLEQKLGRVPRAYELRDALPDSIEDKQAHLKDLQVPTADDHQIYAQSYDPSDMAVHSDARQSRETSHLHDQSQLEKALLALSERARLIVRMRFGLGVPQAYTLEEISQRLGLSRERVRQIAKQSVFELKAALGVEGDVLV